MNRGTNHLPLLIRYLQICQPLLHLDPRRLPFVWAVYAEDVPPGTLLSALTSELSICNIAPDRPLRFFPRACWAWLRVTLGVRIGLDITLSTYTIQ